MRQKYQILIEDKNKVWKELDLGSDNIAWTYQVNDIAELVSRQASYSQNLRLPKTTNNVNVFEHSNNHDVLTDFPYQKHNCRVFCADRTIAGKGSFLLLLKVTDYFECQILSGNANFFEILQNSPMTDLDLGVFQISNAAMNPETWHPAYKLAYGIDVAQPTYPYRAHFNPSVGLLYLAGLGGKYPVLSVDYILQQILSKHGYTFSSNTEVWKNKYLSIDSADVIPSVDDLKIFEGKVEITGWELNSEDEHQHTWSIEKNADERIVHYTHKSQDALRYYIVGDQTMTFSVNVPKSSGEEFLYFSIYFKNAIDEDAVDPIHAFIDKDGPRSYSRTFSNKNITLIKIYAISTYGIPALATGIELNIGNITELLPTNVGGKLILSERTGFETQFDFLKFFAQAFGITYVVNEITKHIHAYTHQLLYDNVKAENVKNWSDKIDRNPKSSLAFTLKQYAQENTISLEENSRDDIPTDIGRFYINNNTLQFSKEMFKIGIGSGSDILVSHNEVNEISASIPLIELRSPGNENDESYPYQHYLFNASFPTIKPHLVELSTRTVPVSTLLAASATYYYQIANHVTAQKIVDMGYSILQDKMLKNARMVEDDFYLTPEDVEQFNPSIPVYIEKYGAYFYVNKIRNFEIGKLTTCELIRL